MNNPTAYQQQTNDVIYSSNKIIAAVKRNEVLSQTTWIHFTYNIEQRKLDTKEYACMIPFI